MKLSRRLFLKLTGMTPFPFIFRKDKGFKDKKFFKSLQEAKVKYGKETTTICPYCGVGCGQIVTFNEELKKVVNIEGDPDHPINLGSLCSKGSALYQVVNNERRLTEVKYRAPYSKKWETKSWDWAISKIAERIKKTRDKSFITTDANGNTINQTQAIAFLGAAAINNEECYLLTKLARALGVVFMEHEARLCHSSTVAGLAESFGRGAMTNHFIDIKNSDCIMVIGSNVAENHPMAFKWITRAMEENGAKLINIDPRFTRTSSKADIYAQMRSGTDIAFIGGLINYTIENGLYNSEYVKEYTTASFLINEEFEFSDGLFSGFDSSKKQYDKTTWSYQVDENGIPKRDDTLTDPHCVFQLMKKHFSRYDVDTVCSITGTPKEDFLKVAEAFCATGAPGKSGTILYAMGTTQHTVATQIIRSYSILQLLLGNIGLAGGGVNAMRGESNVQGSTDFALLFHILPGYLKLPKVEDKDLASYLTHWTPTSTDPKSLNYWKNTPKFMKSLLKAFWGDYATVENDFCYSYLPKISEDHSWISLFEKMYKGTIKGLLCFGMNPAVSGPNLNMERKALEKLDWLVVADLWETETASFWKRVKGKASRIKTEVFLLPAASSVEKEGSITNSGRWIQWRYKATEPLGNAMSDLQIFDQLYKKIRERYESEGGTFPDPITKLNWNYGDPPDPHKIAQEINGYNVTTGDQLKSFAELKDDGTTLCGNWIYCGIYQSKDTSGNMMARRDNSDTSEIGLYPKWAWAWPINRRILYNRASCDSEGKPWDPEHKVIEWNGTEWVGDVPDYGKTTKPEDKIGAFIMRSEGYARLFGKDLADGPFPEHYEPIESPITNPLSSQQNSPVVYIYTSNMDKFGDSSKYPIIATTFRLTEHWQAGAMTRNLPWLVELMPEMFIEIGNELAKEKMIKNGEKVEILTARGKIKAIAMVTDRFKPYKLNGKVVHHIGMPWHFGFRGIARGASANILTPHVGDCNTRIPEYKVFLCDIKKIKTGR